MAEKNNSDKGFLVTGAGGFIGGTAMEHLLARGERVIGTDQRIESELAQKLHLQRLDITDKEETNKFIWNHLPNTILHFAGIAMPKEVARNEDLGRKVNIEAVMNLLDAVVNARKKDPNHQTTVIVAGSVEQFGDPEEGKPEITADNPVTEKSPRNPISPYGKQKEEMALKFLRKCFDEKIRGYVVIQGQVSGVSPSGETSQRTGFLIPDLASQVAAIEASGKEQGVLVTGILDNKRPILDVNDAIEAYLKIAEETPISGEYIVCAEKSRPLKDVLEILIKNSSVRLIHEIEKSRGTGGPDRFYSPKKIMNATGWKPEIEFEQTIKSVLEFQRRYGKKSE